MRDVLVGDDLVVICIKAISKYSIINKKMDTAIKIITRGEQKKQLAPQYLSNSGFSPNSFVPLKKWGEDVTENFSNCL